jgi:glycosyltransferase involved in cell wall biosynthesis
VTSGYPPISPGGAGISSKLIVESLRNIGVSVDVFAIVGKKQKCEKIEEGVWYLPSGEQYNTPKPIGENISAYRHLPHLDGYDLLHTYNVRHIPACIIRSEQPVLSSFNNHMWSCIDPVEHLRDSLPACDIRRNYRYCKTEGYSGVTIFGRLGLHYLGKYLSKRSDIITVQTEGMKRTLVKSGYEDDKIIVIPNILDPRFKSEEGNANNIIFVGQLHEHKAPKMVIKAYRRLPDGIKSNWNLRIYGSGPLKGDIEEYINEYSLEEIKINYRPYDELTEVYNRAGLLVHTSKYTEPFSRCWLEAMASHTPIICSNNPSSATTISEFSELYDPFDVGDLTRCMKQVLKNENKRKKMAKKGYQNLFKYSSKRVSNLYKEAYELAIRRCQS